MPSRPPHSNVVEGGRWRCHRRPSTTFKLIRRPQWECYSNLEQLTMGLLVYTAKYSRAFWYHIISYLNILCSIVSYILFSPMAVSCHHYPQVNRRVSQIHCYWIFHWLLVITRICFN